jgi:hypothetical protein
MHRCFSNYAWQGAGLEAAWINDLQGVSLENGVNSDTPGKRLVERALARLSEEVGDSCQK